MFKKTIKFFVLLLFVSSLSQAQNNQKPNILVILVDDLGFGDLSCQGGTDIQTPHIDKLFDQGLKFNQFYANSTVCSPTRASLITGCYPDMVGVPGVIRTTENHNWGYLKENTIELPTKLKEAGYKTALIGKWHLGHESPNLPNDRGFDHFQGFMGGMMRDYYKHNMLLNKKKVAAKGHATDIFSDWAVEYLENAYKKEDPFFLYLAFNAPHYPIQPPEAWLKKVEKREPQLSEKRAKNVAFVEHLDDAVGRVLQALEKLDKDKNTLIIFSSDNGGHLPSAASNGNLRGGKQDMYEGGIKVPTCFVWKNKIAPGSQTDNLGLTMDIFPTLCEIAGVQVKHKIDGISLYKSLLNEPQNTSNRPVFFVRREGGNYAGLCYYAILDGDYKLVQNTPFEPMQLFNIKEDPQEAHPIKDRKKFNELRSKLSQHIRASGKIPWQKN